MYFISLIIIGNFVLCNLVVAILLEGALHAASACPTSVSFRCSPTSSAAQILAVILFCSIITRGMPCCLGSHHSLIRMVTWLGRSPHVQALRTTCTSHAMLHAGFEDRAREEEDAIRLATTGANKNKALLTLKDTLLNLVHEKKDIMFAHWKQLTFEVSTSFSVDSPSCSRPGTQGTARGSMQQGAWGSSIVGMQLSWHNSVAVP